MTLSKQLFVAIFFLTLSSTMGQQSPASEGHTLKVGDAAPTFELESQTGEKVALENLLKKGPVALVFYRSAQW